jgi:hypothetical protein
MTSDRDHVVSTEHFPSGPGAHSGAVAVWMILSLLFLPSSAAVARQCDSDLAIFKSAVGQAMAEHKIDAVVYGPLQKQIAMIQAVCGSGDDQKARAMVINGMMALSFGEDDTYGRAVNKPQQEQVGRP